MVVNGKLNLKRFAVTPNDKQFVLDSSTNFGYGNASTTIAGMAAHGYQHFGQTNQKFAVLDVTGSHAFKAGIQTMQGWRNTLFSMEAATNETSYVFNGRVPTTVNYFASPLGDKGRQLTVGTFVQDQWTIDRLTLNLGMRYDYLNGRVPPVTLPAGLWVPARTFPEVKNVPNWKDWTPRVGAAYDLFGSGRTAVKGFVGRYVIFEPMGGIILQNSPVNSMVTTASRAWTDANGDYVPQDSELGPLSNASFGQVVRRTTFADEVLTGNRPYNWQGSLQLQQQLWNGVAINVGYFRTWYGNFRVTVNEAVTVQDFNPYCVTAPSNQALPGGGGQSICGLYDVVPAKFGQSNSLITLADEYGKHREVYNGVDVTMTARFGRGGFLQGGVDRHHGDQQLLPERAAEYHRTRFAGLDAEVARVLRHQHALVRQHAIQSVGGIPDLVGFPGERELPGPAARSHGGGLRGIECRGATSLGRSLAACGTRVPCTSTVTVDVVLPNINYQEPRLHQLDLRFSRTFQLPRGGSIEPQFDIFNATISTRSDDDQPVWPGLA